MKTILKTSLMFCAVFLCSYVFADAVVTQGTDNGRGDIQGSLSWAVNQGGPVTFKLPSGTNTITLTQGAIPITQSVTIQGSGQTVQVQQPGVSNFGVFTIDIPGATPSSTPVTIKNLNLCGGNVGSSVKNPGYGGVIRIPIGNVTLDSVRVQDGRAFQGGGIFINGSNSKLTLRNGCYVYNNTASNDGGGIYVTDSAQLLLKGSCVGKDYKQPSTGGPNAAVSGGGICVAMGGQATIDNSLVCQNSASMYGGGIKIDNGGSLPDPIVTIQNNSLVNDNHATLYGGGIYVFNAYLKVTGSDVSYNSASTKGGGICTILGNVKLNQTNVYSNSLTSTTNCAGVGIDNEGGILNIMYSTIAYNTASENPSNNGGGISNAEHGGTQGQCIVVMSTIYGNESGRGGGIAGYGNDEAVMGIFSCTVINNNAGIGQGVYSNGTHTLMVVALSAVDNLVSDNASLIEMYAVMYDHTDQYSDGYVEFEAGHSYCSKGFNNGITLLTEPWQPGYHTCVVSNATGDSNSFQSEPPLGVNYGSYLYWDGKNTYGAMFTDSLWGARYYRFEGNDFTQSNISDLSTVPDQNGLTPENNTVNYVYGSNAWSAAGWY